MAYKNHPFQSVGKIRIIGGQWCGRKLTVLDSPGLRPTTDRMRETLYNWLTPVLQGTHCLDCFAGSGALGLEALSRTAASVTLLEQDRTVSAQLSKNLQLLSASQAKVITVDSLHWLAQPGEQFDVVFIDPPFHQGMINDTVSLLERYCRLADEAWIYIESEISKTVPVVPIYWQLYREKINRQVAYRLYIRRAIGSHYSVD